MSESDETAPAGILPLADGHREMSGLPELYLDLLKKTLTRAIVSTGIERHTLSPQDGPKSRLACQLNRLLKHRWLEIVRLRSSTPEEFFDPGLQMGNRVDDAETMLGLRQLDHMQHCISDVLTRDVPGDLLEAGVWRGGMSIFMRAGLKAYRDESRKLFVADSFAGLPEINRQIETFDWNKGDLDVSLEMVRKNFIRYGLLDDRVVFLKGYFADTLPRAPIRQLSILRIDADLYESTMDVLRNLYDRLSPGGYAIFDDYRNLPDCRRAIDEFRRDRNITEEIRSIDQRAVCWQKHRSENI
jgi:SAM-dependent methyltransferase